jgi:hypothetical protein
MIDQDPHISIYCGLSYAALKLKRHADESVVAGREFVEAYVQFTHYAEGIHRLLKGAAPHHEHP